MTFQMRKVQPAGVKSVSYLAEMFPGVDLNIPVVVNVIAGKSVNTYQGWGRMISLTLQSSSRLSLHLGGFEENERMLSVKTSHVLQLACL